MCFRVGMTKMLFQFVASLCLRDSSGYSFQLAEHLTAQKCINFFAGLIYIDDCELFPICYNSSRSILKQVLPSLSLRDPEQQSDYCLGELAACSEVKPSPER